MNTPNRRLLPGQPDDAALWIYTANRSLTTDECTTVLQSLSGFLNSWTSHERSVVADASVLFERFLIVGGHIPGGDVSGCGIDKLVHAAEKSANDIGISWIHALNVVYRALSGDILSATRAEFRQMAEASVVDAETRVFDTGLTTVSQLREGGFEITAGRSWHGRVFALAAGVNV